MHLVKGQIMMSYAFREATWWEGDEWKSFSQIIDYSVFNILFNSHSTKVETCSKNCKENGRCIQKKGLEIPHGKKRVNLHVDYSIK